jgi:hypothetical protein
VTVDEGQPHNAISRSRALRVTSPRTAKRASSWRTAEACTAVQLRWVRDDQGLAGVAAKQRPDIVGVAAKQRPDIVRVDRDRRH